MVRITANGFGGIMLFTAFAPVPDLARLGIYESNNSTDGVFIIPFRPRFIF